MRLDGWRIVALWREHTITMGPRKGVVVRAEPVWYAEEGCYRVIPSGSNHRVDSLACTTLEAVAERLADGWGVRVRYDPGPGDNILYGDFKAMMTQRA
jgi:hypothetical protein